MEGETESEVSVLCQNFVLEPVSCAQIDTQLYNCKQAWPLSRDDNLASAPDRNVDSVNACIFQDVNVSTADIEEKMPAREDGACKEGNEAPQSQLGGPSLAENVETPTSSSSLSTQPGEHNHQNNHDATHTLDQVASDHHVVDDENRLLSDGRMAALRIHTQYTNESPCNLVTQVQNLDADSTVEVSTSSPVPQTSDAADSTCRQSMENEQERDGFSADPSCSNVADSSRLPGVEKEGNGQHDLALPSNLSDFSLQPRRSTRCNKYSKAEKKKTPALRLRSKPVNKKLLPGKCFLNAVRRKRSCLYNRARASIWGSLANISQVKVDDGARKDGNHLIQSENQRSHKRRGGSGDGRRQKTNAGSSFPTKELSGVSTDHSAHTRLKVKFGGQSGNRSLNVIESEMLYPSLMLPTPGGKCATRPGNPTSTEISDCENYNSGRYTYANGDCEDVLPFPCARFQDSLSVDKDLESTITQDTSDLHRLGNCSLGYSQIRTEGTEEAVGKQYSDPGTSPDSEVINLIQDVSAGTNAGFVSTQAIDPTDAAASTMELLSLRKQKISCKVESTAFSLAGSLALEGKLLECNKKMSPVENRREEEVRGHNPSDTSSLGSNENGSQSYSNAEGHFNQSAEHENVGDVPRVETIDRSSEFLGPNIGVISSELLGPNVLLGSGETRGLKPSSKSSAKERKKSVSASNRRKNAHGKRKEEDQKSINKRKIKEKDSPSQVQENHRQSSGSINISLGTTELSESGEPSECFKVETTVVAIRNDLGISIASNIAPKDLSNSSVLSSGYDEQLLPSPDAWVRCDECHKWRCISTELADSIEATNCRWICSENMDKAFADCSIPQEKSNAEINRELELAEFSGEEDASCAHPVAKGFPDKDLTVSQQAPWKPIVSNLFLHRTRKTQTIDEIMICHCKPPLDGGLGCGDECLNRMLNIECVRGTCPCGDRCSNQQFQKRKYAKMESVRCGKKGYGLQLLDNVSEGDFLIEYVGEVLDLNAYEARQREYASRGQRHFYFMTLNGSEVIDACAKGNLGRFINHSCDPNCRTEKWMVNGEVCIGLFAIRNIKKGEELTFDYNYVRVFGAAAKRCVCGSSDCRGYIGGDPLNNGAVVQGDSDEEFPEPVMVDDGCEIGKGRGEVASNTILSDDELPKRTDPISASFIPPLENSINKEDDAVGRGRTVQPIEILPGKEERINEDTITRSLCAVQPIETLLIKEETVKEETITRSLSPIQPPEISISDTKNESSVIQPLGDSLLKDNTVGKVLPAIQYPDALSTVTVTTKRFISDTAEERHKSSKARSTGKLPRSSCSIKKANSISKPVSASKSQVLASKPKKVMEVFASSHPKGAEDMLNSLLDTDGGISKQKDATRGYLMLLFVTASSGDNINGEAVQSTRDLSITLDALLKTRKRNVLKDIVNKNGLQMLHNIMKQNRKNFSRIPIIRKLLKILDHLAERGVLTLEHINSAPPRAGMESFRESIFQLTRHSDVKVHQIARDFRDKWIPRSFRSNTYSDGNQINSEPQVGLHSNRFSPYRRWGNNSPRPMEDSESIGQRALQAIPSYANAPEDSSGPRVNYYSANSRSCKRKSRWDQPEPNSGQQSLEFAHGRKEKRKFVPCPQLPETREVIMGQVDEVNHETVCYGYSISKQCEDSASVEQHMDGDSPPGFPSAPPVQGDGFSTVMSNLPSDIHHRMCSCEVVTGTLQEVYDSESPVAYGVPVLFVDQFGTPVADSTDSWEISPGIPFHPFPPLPPYSRKETNGLAPLKNMENRDSQRDGPRDLYNQADPGVACTSGERTAEVCNHGAQNRPIVEQMRHTPGNLGRRYFRQEKWNNPRHHHPHWIGNRNAWRFKEKNPRSNACRLGVGSVENHVGHTEDEGGSGGIDQNSIPPSAYQNL